jgi:hypothetical protein
MKKEKNIKKINRKFIKYHIRCIGTNNTVNIFDDPFGFEITSRSNQIDDRGIGKSTLPGLEQGTIVTKTSNAEIIDRSLPAFSGQFQINFSPIKKDQIAFPFTPVYQNLDTKWFLYF